MRREFEASYEGSEPRIETARRGQKAFGFGEGFPETSTAKGRASTEPDTGLQFAPEIDEASLSELKDQLPPLPEFHSAAEESAPTPKATSRVASTPPDFAADELYQKVAAYLENQGSPLVKETVDAYCNKYFRTIAEEIILSELRRLADERSRLLADS